MHRRFPADLISTSSESCGFIALWLNARTVGTPVDERRAGREPLRFEPRIDIWRLAGVESSHSLRPVRMVG
jgi:hypothetical protein